MDMLSTSAGTEPLKAITVVAESTVLDLHAFLSDAFLRVAPEVAWLSPDQVTDPAVVDVALCWYPAPDALHRYPKLELIQSLGAGTDHLHPALRSLPDDLSVCRVTDSHMSRAMSGYVAWAVLNQQRQFKAYAAQQAEGRWLRHPMQSAGEHCVGIAGQGQLGAACAGTLLELGFQVRGWARDIKLNMPAALTQFAGPESLEDFLSGCDTLVCLLPLTPDTQGFIGERVLRQLPPHAHVINASRGEHVDQDALLSALDTGRLAHATLDVFHEEPLPPEHPYWKHPRITVTPHVGARTPNDQIVRQMLDNLLAIRAGGRPRTWVDRARGY